MIDSMSSFLTASDFGNNLAFENSLKHISNKIKSLVTEDHVNTKMDLIDAKLSTIDHSLKSILLDSGEHIKIVNESLTKLSEGSTVDHLGFLTSVNRCKELSDSLELTSNEIGEVTNQIKSVISRNLTDDQKIRLVELYERLSVNCNTVKLILSLKPNWKEVIKTVTLIKDSLSK